MTAILDTARGYLAAGLSVIPIRADGSKAPAESGWRAFSERQPSPDELQHWFGNGHTYGIGIPGGPASGNLAVLDFETWDAYERWLRSLPFVSQEITRRCPLVKTPGGGAHLYVRLTDPVKGTVLARRYDPTGEKNDDGTPKEKTLIEVRANGEQVVAPGSPARCHKLDKEYEWLRRSWLDGLKFEPVELDEWMEWLIKAEELNEVERKPEVKPDRRPRTVMQGEKPGDDFNRRGTWEEAGLFGSGWQWHRQEEDDRGFVTRPGKKKGISGSVGMVAARDGGHDLFYCFTSNGHPFEHKQSYSRYRVYAILKHKGDFEAAAKALGEAGYGSQGYNRNAARYSFKGGNYSNSQSASSEQTVSSTQPTTGPKAPTPVKPPLPLVYYSDISPALDAADFVEGLLIDGAMSVIYGESGCGKTFFTLDLALHVAAGSSWRGREVERRGVLYLALEGSHGIRNRIAAFKQGRTANAADLPLAVVPVALNLLDPEGDTFRVIEAAKLAAERLTIPVGLIVVDTLSRAMAGGNENSPEDMGALVRHLDLIRQALPSHVAVVHHSGKDAARGARGHSLLRAATDTEIEITREISTKTSTARVTKQRELELGDEFPFCLVPVELGTNRRGKAVTSCVVRANEPAPAVDRRLEKEMERERLKKKLQDAMSEEADNAVLRVIREEHVAGLPGASRTAIRKRAKCRRERVDEAIERLLEAGAIVRSQPFTKVSGNNAKTEVTDGFTIAPKSDSGLFKED